MNANLANKSKDELKVYADSIITFHTERQAMRVNPLTMNYLQELSTQMMNKKIYKQTIKILNILKIMDDCAHVFQQLAECQAKEGNYVEAALNVD